jgi:hypothetical protein
MNLEYLSIISKALLFLFLDIRRLSIKSRHNTNNSILRYLISYRDPYNRIREGFT